MMSFEIARTSCNRRVHATVQSMVDVLTTISFVLGFTVVIENNFEHVHILCFLMWFKS